MTLCIAPARWQRWRADQPREVGDSGVRGERGGPAAVPPVAHGALAERAAPARLQHRPLLADRHVRRAHAARQRRAARAHLAALDRRRAGGDGDAGRREARRRVPRADAAAARRGARPVSARGGGWGREGQGVGEGREVGRGGT